MNKLSEKLFHCRVCDKEILDDHVRNVAQRKLAQQVCSLKCLARDIKRRYACCEKAVPTECVCTYSFKCPEHGETHIGTHD